uniref:SCP domain-containing protein n=1 Tax=Strongyloides papillosus TaxID=174720 RepID=A0A0N5BLQ4_STREA
MRISIIVYVSITFIIDLVKTQELAVAYMTVHIGVNKMYYSYRDKFYATFSQLVGQIIKNHRYVDPKYLLMTKVSSLNYGEAYIKQERKYRKIYTGQFLKHKPILIIEEFYLYKKLRFMCNGRTFTSYQKALEYVLNEKINNPIRHTRRPSSTILPPLENVNWLEEKVYCKKFWLILWRNCDYYCYSRNNFEVMKQKFLSEINYYREKYGVGKLVESPQLSSTALRYLNEIVSLRSRMDVTKFENVGKASLARAPLIVNHWFGEHKSYKWNTRFGSTETRHFTAMVWNKTSKIGIAVLRVNNEIFLKIMYDNKVNIPNQFEENILKKVNGRYSGRG